MKIFSELSKEEQEDLNNTAIIECQKTDEVWPFIEKDCIEHFCFEGHKRGKNWLGILNGKNSVSMQIDFCKMKGKIIDISPIKLGDAFEIGGDYISSGGIRHPDRYQYVLISKNEKYIVIRLYPTRAKAMQNRIKKEEQQ